MDALIDLIKDIKEARNMGLNDDVLTNALMCQRRAQFLLDFVEAENSTGFHAPQEAARVVGLSLDYARRGQVAVRDAMRKAESSSSKSISELLPQRSPEVKWQLTQVTRAEAQPR
jgi:formate-dependent nitrite reductase cytochrome c552 subunit